MFRVRLDVSLRGFIKFWSFTSPKRISLRGFGKLWG